jgi:hypothetical protein
MARALCVVGQSYKASELSFAAGEVYAKHGLIQQGSEFMERGAKLAESAAALQKAQADQSQRMWSHIGSSLDTVQEGSPTASQDWDKLRMTFPLMFPEEAKHPEVQKFLQKPYDPQTIQLLKRASISAADQAELAKTKAETQRANAAAKFEAAGIPLRQAEAREHSARANAIEKTGGKPPSGQEINNAKSLIMADYPEADPKGYALYASEIAERAKALTIGGQDKDSAYQQAYQEIKDSGKLNNLPAKASKKEQAASEVRNDLVDDIDDLITDMETTPGSAGLRGRMGRIGEFASTATGVGDQEAPLTAIMAKADAIRLKMPKALTGSSKSAKDERELVASISDIARLGTSDKTAITKLRAVQERLKSMNAKTITGKGAKSTGSPVKISSDAEYDKLAPGTEFTGPDGVKRRKP